MNASGRFVLRVPPELHLNFRQEAKVLGISLNDLILRRLTTGGVHSPVAAMEHVVKLLGEKLAGCVLFGSAVRGQMRASSDVDLLLVLNDHVAIDRGLYRIWDESIAPAIGDVYSPQFSHLPSALEASSLWLEAALDGEVIWDPRTKVKMRLREIRAEMAAGRYQRKLVHGHPYWIRNEDVRAE